MAKQMVYFNATKQIETITIHYNDKLDGAFVADVAQTVKDLAKKMSKVNLKEPKEFDTIKVFVYPSKKLFYQVFGGEIEKRFYRRRRSLEDLYVVQDAEGNIHIVSPRGMEQEKREALKKILVMKVLGEYMEEKEKISAEKLLKEVMKPKEQEEPDEHEPQEEPEEELDDEELEVQDEEEPAEEVVEELTEDQMNELLDAQQQLEEIDAKCELEESAKQCDKPKVSRRTEAQEWLSVGWLAYVSGRLKKQQDIQKFAEHISKNGIKKLGQLSDTRLMESYNFSREYACAWVEYIVSTYGMKKLIEHYEQPKDIKGVFGVPKYIFENQLKAYIKEKYKLDEKTLNITSDIKLDDILTSGEPEMEREQENAISDVTQVHFAKGGGADITSHREIAQPEIKEKV